MTTAELARALLCVWISQQNTLQGFHFLLQCCSSKSSPNIGVDSRTKSIFCNKLHAKMCRALGHGSVVGTEEAPAVAFAGAGTALSYGKPPRKAQLQAGAFCVGITTRCQCLKLLLHPQQATKTGGEGAKLVWLLLRRISAGVKPPLISCL